MAGTDMYCKSVNLPEFLQIYEIYCYIDNFHRFGFRIFNIQNGLEFPGLSPFLVTHTMMEMLKLEILFTTENSTRTQSYHADILDQLRGIADASYLNMESKIHHREKCDVGMENSVRNS